MLVHLFRNKCSERRLAWSEAQNERLRLALRVCVCVCGAG